MYMSIEIIRCYSIHQHVLHIIYHNIIYHLTFTFQLSQWLCRCAGQLPSLVLSQPLLGQMMVDLLHLAPTETLNISKPNLIHSDSSDTMTT